MLGIAPGGKGVWGILRKDRDPGHRQPRSLRQILNNSIKVRIIVGGYLLPLIHRDDHLIAEPVTEEIHAAGENERDQRALPSAHEISSPNEQSGKNGQKNGGSKGIHRSEERRVGKER